jgi:hypothetical protein
VSVAFIALAVFPDYSAQGRQVFAVFSAIENQQMSVRFDER